MRGMSERYSINAERKEEKEIKTIPLTKHTERDRYIERERGRESRREREGRSYSLSIE